MSLAQLTDRPRYLDLSRRSKLVFKGEQALWFLDQLLTNKLDDLEAGKGAEALLLTPKGRITSHMRVLSTGTAAFVDAPQGQADKLKEFFEQRIFTTKVEIINRTKDFSIISVIGGKADEVVGGVLEEISKEETPEQRELGLSLPGSDEHDAQHFGSAVSVRRIEPAPGLDVWLLEELKEKFLFLLASSRIQQMGRGEFLELCAVAGTPTFAVDFDESFLPQEAALERAVHFEKGCYLGQEAVAMAQRGTVKRRLRHLSFEAEPTRGRVTFEGGEVGKVTNVGSSDSGRFGIGIVKTAVPIGSTVEVVGAGATKEATLSELPRTESGPKGPSARELRESLEGGS